MKTSYKKAIEFSYVASKCLKEYPKEEKFVHAINKVLKRMSSFDEKYRDMKEDTELDHANTDKFGSALYKMVPTKDGGEVKVYDFTPENTKVVRDKLRVLLTDELFEIEPYYAARIPEGINPEYLTFLRGFVIEDTVEEETEE